MKVLILGATSAIAIETARILAQEKAELFLVARDENRLKTVRDDLIARGAQNVFCRGMDLSDAKLHDGLLKAVEDAIPGFDTALLAYGTLGNQKEGEKDFSAAWREIHTNFVSAASLVTLIANSFELRRAGSIAVISSVAGDRGRQSNYIYGASKGALSLFVQGVRNRLQPYGVNVLTIKPGFVDTPMTKDIKKGLLFVSPKVVAKGIVRAIKKKKDVVYLPWFWLFIMLIIRHIPERIFKRLRL